MSIHNLAVDQKVYTRLHWSWTYQTRGSEQENSHASGCCCCGGGGDVDGYPPLLLFLIFSNAMKQNNNNSLQKREMKEYNNEIKQNKANIRRRGKYRIREYKILLHVLLHLILIIFFVLSYKSLRVYRKSFAVESIFEHGPLSE